jgi:hypothetical protein
VTGAAAGTGAETAVLSAAAGSAGVTDATEGRRDSGRTRRGAAPPPAAPFSSASRSAPPGTLPGCVHRATANSPPRRGALNGVPAEAAAREATSHDRISSHAMARHAACGWMTGGCGGGGGNDGWAVPELARCGATATAGDALRPRVGGDVMDAGDENEEDGDAAVRPPTRAPS